MANDNLAKVIPTFTLPFRNMFIEREENLLGSLPCLILKTSLRSSLATVGRFRSFTEWES